MRELRVLNNNRPATQKKSFVDFMKSEISMSRMKTSRVYSVVHNIVRQVTVEAAFDISVHAGRANDRSECLISLVRNSLFPQTISAREKEV